MAKWRIEDSEELYNIGGWGVNFFGVNKKGNVYVTPCKNDVQIDLKELVDDLVAHRTKPPMLLRFPDYDDAELQSMVLLDTLQADAPALNSEQSRLLYERVLLDYADVRPKSKRMKKVMEDTYYNALQIKFGYAVTCHKAQGGQWAHVYIDQGYLPADMLTSDYVHWLYTAFTRATERLFLVNWPKNQVEQE